MKTRAFSVLGHLVVTLILSTSAQAQTSLSSVKLSEYPGAVKPVRGVNPGIASGSHSGIYVRFAEDISDMCIRFGDPEDKVNNPAIKLNVFATQGSFDSIKRLRTEDEVQLAIVQSDIWYYAQQHSDVNHLTKYHGKVDNEIRQIWAKIKEDINLILPLYTEAIHIVIREESKGEYKDLADLFNKGAVVNIGAMGSGTAITCTLLEEMFLREPDMISGVWKKKYYSRDAALDLLTKPRPKNASQNGERYLDAVILIGGVPFPALERFGLKQIQEEVKKRNILGRQTVDVVEKEVGELVLLPFGDVADEIVDSNRDEFGGYVKTEIPANAYNFLFANPNPIKTRGVTACLVTHSSYTDKAAAANHKIRWVRHIVKRVLTKLSTDPDSTYGLSQDFGIPRAGSLWKDVAANLSQIQEGERLKASGGNGGYDQGITWTDFGWNRHPDPKIIEMVDLWLQRYGYRDTSTTPLFDPR
tara:strand:- start:16615 stop:18030 length:1416 start_codon:yes stop_codon:yes gene_type:complete